MSSDASGWILAGGNTGGPFCGMSDYVKYINKTGVDTEYWRQVAELLIIYEQFLEDYIACYYATTLADFRKNSFFFPLFDHEMIPHPKLLPYKHMDIRPKNII